MRLPTRLQLVVMGLLLAGALVDAAARWIGWW